MENNNQSVLSESVYDKNLFQSVSGISLFLFSILGHLSDENGIYSIYRMPSNQETSALPLWAEKMCIRDRSCSSARKKDGERNRHSFPLTKIVAVLLFIEEI